MKNLVHCNNTRYTTYLLWLWIRWQSWSNGYCQWLRALRLNVRVYYVRERLCTEFSELAETTGKIIQWYLTYNIFHARCNSANSQIIDPQCNESQLYSRESQQNITWCKWARCNSANSQIIDPQCNESQLYSRESQQNITWCKWETKVSRKHLKSRFQQAIEWLTLAMPDTHFFRQKVYMTCPRRDSKIWRITSSSEDITRKTSTGVKTHNWFHM